MTVGNCVAQPTVSPSAAQIYLYPILPHRSHEILDVYVSAKSSGFLSQESLQLFVVTRIVASEGPDHNFRFRELFCLVLETFAYPNEPRRPPADFTFYCRRRGYTVPGTLAVGHIAPVLWLSHRPPAKGYLSR
jgi:hypothetical protein